MAFSEDDAFDSTAFTKFAPRRAAEPPKPQPGFGQAEPVRIVRAIGRRSADGSGRKITAPLGVVHSSLLHTRDYSSPAICTAMETLVGTARAFPTNVSHALKPKKGLFQTLVDDPRLDFRIVTLFDFEMRN